jgi:hypothetical protein
MHFIVIAIAVVCGALIRLRAGASKRAQRMPDSALDVR